MSALATEFAERVRILFDAEPDAEEWRIRKVTMAAKDEFTARGIYVPRNIIAPVERALMTDAIEVRWRPVPGGAVATEGNLIHLRLDDDVEPWTGDDDAEANDDDLGAQALALEQAAQAAGQTEMAAALKRMRLGMSRSAGGNASGMSAADLLAMCFPDIKWVVPGYLTEGLTLLAGAPKIGKSWLALGLALAVASGGRAFEEVECEAGTVLYLALEDNFRRLQSRLRLMGVTAGPAGLHFETTWPSIDEGCVARMSSWLDDNPDARMIVVDVFAKIKSAKGGNKPQYEADYKDVTALQRLALDRGVAIVLVHHTRKAEADGDPFDLVSGTRGLTGSADSTFVLTRGSGQAQPSLYGRGRDITEIEQAMTFDPSTCRWSIAGPVVELQASPERQAILKVLRASDESMKLADIAEAAQKSAANVNNMLSKMVADGTVRKVATGLYEIAPPPARPWPSAPS